MNRRLTGLLAAGALALIGTIVLVGYVQSAEARALSGEELVDVLVVTEPIEAGTSAEDIADSVAKEQVPSKVRADHAITDLEAVEGKLVAVDLLPGEQLVAGRFSEAVDRTRPGVPDDLLEVTVSLTPERALGGQLRPGDRVAVVSSFEPFEIDESLQAAAGGAKKTPNTSHLILHKVLVTNVQVSANGAPVRGGDDDDENRAAAAPSGSMLVTLALDAASVQQVVFTAEYGSLWLSAEPAEAPESVLIIETRGSVYR